MRQIFGEFIGGRAAFGLLVLRLVSGAALMVHGWPKIQKPFGWMGDGPGVLSLDANLFGPRKR